MTVSSAISTGGCKAARFRGMGGGVSFPAIWYFVARQPASAIVPTTMAIKTLEVFRFRGPPTLLAFAFALRLAFWLLRLGLRWRPFGLLWRPLGLLLRARRLLRLARRRRR